MKDVVLENLHESLIMRWEAKKFVEKLFANLQDKIEYVIHIRNLKQALIHGLIWKKVHKAIKFK